MKKIIVYFFCLLLALSCLGCGGNHEEIKDGKASSVPVHEEVKKEVEQMVIAVNVDNSTSSLPFSSVLLNRSQFWGGLVFQGLLVPDEGINNVQPDLCEEYSVSPNGETYVFILKEDLYWHDGKPLTTEDVLWSIEACLLSREVNGFMKSGLQSIVGAAAYEQGNADKVEGISISEKEVVIKLERVDGTFLAAIAQVPILPKHCLKDVEKSDLSESEFWKMPIGSGPYKVVENKDNKDALLVVNEDYSGKKPKIKQIRYKVLDNPDKDNFDFAISSDSDIIKKFQEDFSYQVVPTTNLYYRYLYFNIDGKEKHNKGLLDDARIRQALVMGLDRKSIIDKVYGGVALPIDCGIPETDSWFVEKNEDQIGYSTRKAKQLLEEAKFDFNSTLVLTRYHEDEKSVELLEEVADYWKELGIKVEIRPVKSNDINKLWVDTDWYDVGLKNLAAVDYNEWYFEYASSNQLWSTILNNRREFDVLIAAMSSAKWAYERAVFYEEIQQLEVEHVFKIPLTIIPQYVIYNKERLHIPEMQFPNMWYYFDLNIEQWEMES